MSAGAAGGCARGPGVREAHPRHLRRTSMEDTYQCMSARVSVV